MQKIEDLQKSFYIINEIKIGKLEEFLKKNFFKYTKFLEACLYLIFLQMYLKH